MSEPIYDNIGESQRVTVVTQFGVPISPTEALRGLRDGHSFVVDTDQGRRSVVSAAYRLGISIKTAKEESGRYRICLK